MRYIILTWVIFLVVQFTMPLLAAWRIGRVREANSYNNYVRLLLWALAAKNLLGLWSLGDIVVLPLPTDYVVKRIAGLLLEGAATILLSLYLLGIINGIGWFGKPPPPPAE